MKVCFEERAEDVKNQNNKQHNNSKNKKKKDFFNPNQNKSQPEPLELDLHKGSKSTFVSNDAQTKTDEIGFTRMQSVATVETPVNATIGNWARRNFAEAEV